MEPIKGQSDQDASEPEAGGHSVGVSKTDVRRDSEQDRFSRIPGVKYLKGAKIAWQNRHLWRPILEGRPLVRDRQLIELVTKLLKTSERLECDGWRDLSFRRVVGDRDGLFVVTADVLGRREHFQFGPDDNVPQRVVDSARIPFLYGNAHYDRHSHQYFDGGLTANLPVEILEPEIDKYGPVLAFSFEPVAYDYSPPQSPWDLARSLIETTIEAAVSKASRIERRQVYVIKLPSLVSGTLAFSEAQEQLSAPFDLKSLERIKKELLEIRLPVGREHYNFINDYKRSRRAVSGHESDTFLKVLVDYPADQTCRLAQIDIIDKIESVSGKMGQGFAGRGNIDVAFRSDLGVSVPAVYPFPFLLTRARRGIWGVVPIGEHSAIASIVHPDNQMAYEILKRAEWNPEKSKVKSVWLDELSYYSDQGELRFLLADGYIAQEIFPEMLIDVGGTLDPLKFYSNSGGSGSPARVSFLNSMPNMADRQEFLSFPPVSPPSDFSAKTDIILTDLATARGTVEALQHDGMEIIPVPHSLDIPVGIGFTMLAGAIFEDRSRWKVFAGFARKAYKPLEAFMLQNGIRLYAERGEEQLEVLNG